jgi:hypothetical protein
MTSPALRDALAALKISNKPDYWKGVTNGIRATVTWLHPRQFQ